MTVKNIFYIILITCIFLSNGYSQILNIEKSRLGQDSTKKFLGSINFNIALNNQSATDSAAITFLGLSGATNVGYQTPLHIYMFLNSINYLSTNDEAFVSTGYSHFRANFLKKRKLSYETFAQYQFDKFRGLYFRGL